MGRQAVPVLIEALRDADSDVRHGAAYALGYALGEIYAFVQIEPKASGAVPALIEALHDAVDDVRHAAAEAIHRIEPDSCIDSIEMNRYELYLTVEIRGKKVSTLASRHWRGGLRNDNPRPYWYR
ncbi:MAG: HEAT repeat domain-containing protein [Acidobacteriaceae bacterium]|jgi:hypothetical protein